MQGLVAVEEVVVAEDVVGHILIAGSLQWMLMFFFTQDQVAVAEVGEGEEDVVGLFLLISSGL